MDCEICGQPIDEARMTTYQGEDGTPWVFCSWHKPDEITDAWAHHLSELKTETDD